MAKKVSKQDGERENKLLKIVYFDEGSATDYMQVANGGSMESVMELVREDESSADAGAKAKASARTKLINVLAGLDASAGVEGGLRSSFSSATVAKSILSSTVLTDFLEAAEEAGKGSINRFINYTIEQIPGSVSSISLFTPYFAMFRSGQNFSAGDFDISIDKLDNALCKAKGYLDFYGCPNDGDDHAKDRKKIVLRFNRSALKNNYRPTDLLKMDLMLYAVRVGSCSAIDLMANRELNFGGTQTVDNPDYEDESNASEAPGDDAELEMYDVILAGVACRG